LKHFEPHTIDANFNAVADAEILQVFLLILLLLRQLERAWQSLRELHYERNSVLAFFNLRCLLKAEGQCLVLDKYKGFPLLVQNVERSAKVESITHVHPEGATDTSRHFLQGLQATSGSVLL